MLLLVSFVVLAWALLSNADIPVLNPSGEVSAQQRNLFVFTIGLSLLVVVPVYVLLAVFALKYRSTNKKATYRPEWGESKILERLWWGIPIAIIAVLAVVTHVTSHSLDPYKPLAGEDTLEVEVVALRWKWLFLYPDEGIATLNHLPIPVDRPVHFTMTADAPMSAFWIPALGSQIYAMTGMSSELNLRGTKIGSFTGYTTNINGEGYADMTFETKVLSEDDYKAWVTQAKSSSDEMNELVYKTMSKPKVDTSQKTYKLGSQDLYQTIIDKYMGHDGTHTTDHGGHH